MGKKYATTLGTEGLILASQLLVYRWAASRFGQDGFAEYALARRAISLMQPLALLGLGTAIPRYLALSIGQGSRSRAKDLFAGGCLVLCASTAILLAFLHLFKGPVASLFFGSSNYGYLLPPVGLMLAGLALYTACYSYFRGSLNMAAANGVHFLNLGLLPIVIFWRWGSSVAVFLSLLGGCTAVVSALVLLSTNFMGTIEIRKPIKELLTYGVGRVPADFFQLALLTAPSILVAHLEGVRTAGFVAFAVSLLTMVASLLVAIGMVLLPEASRMIGRGDLQGMIRRFAQVTWAIVVVVTPVIILVELFARQILQVYFGSPFTAAAPILCIVALAALPYSIYVGMKSAIDAISREAINSKNTLIALLAFVVTSLAAYRMGLGTVPMLFFFVISVYLLGGLTLLEIRKFRQKTANLPAHGTAPVSEGPVPVSCEIKTLP